MMEAICEFVFWPRNFHEINNTQLCIWIAFLRYALQFH